MLNVQIIDTGKSRSFPNLSEFNLSSNAKADILLIIGQEVHQAFKAVSNQNAYQLILLELGEECLGIHTGESLGNEGSHVLGFARYKMGDDPATKLIELVKQPKSKDQSLETAKSFFESFELVVAVCADTPGRIVDRLIRPYLNSVLRRLDDGLATAEDMDKTLKLGLGYPEGPLAMLQRSGLEHHAQVTESLYQALGNPGFFPARRALVAKKMKSN
jgi:3-hydroxybutyryl-CoA dehydrogenase